jgi:alpha-beta hydrolase superfamily lysophospholipase
VSTIAITDRVLRVASGGVKLRVREWLPRGPEKGQVLLLHGLGDHSARHDWAASLFTDAGYRAVGFDWPGNGESDGVRGDMPTVAESGRLIEEVIEALDLRPCGIFAHSTGAFLVLHWLGDMFDPELAGYWGTHDFETALDVVVDLIERHAAKVEGIKI